MRLRYKLSLLFVAVIAAGSATTLALVVGTTGTMFRSFIFSGDAEKASGYAAILAEYHLENGSWDDADAFISGLPSRVSMTIESGIQGTGHADGAVNTFPDGTLRSLMPDRVVVADADGVIVADTAARLLGTPHPASHLSHGVPIVAGPSRVGTVLVGSMIDSSLSGIGERYLRSVTWTIVWSSLGSSAIALLVGFIVASRMTRPLGALAAAAKGIVSGKASSPVPVRGDDELAQLAASFNEMVAELSRLDSAKKRVIADSAHELRTPVTLIRGMIEGMIDGVFPRDNGTLESVHEETLRLSRLIDTLRELEIIESGELELEIEGVDLGETLRKAVLTFSPEAMARSIRLSFEPAESTPSLVRGDRLRLGEVVYNLVANAIKYTPEGGAVIVRERPESDSGSLVVFSVDDSGPGIPAGERERIFERFYRLDRSRTGATGGRGLGLAIAAEIVKAHGGRIRVEPSGLGGSSFIVSLPRFCLQ